MFSGAGIEWNALRVELSYIHTRPNLQSESGVGRNCKSITVFVPSFSLLAVSGTPTPDAVVCFW